LHIDDKICVRRAERTQLNVTRALALPKKQHNREHKVTSQEHYFATDLVLLSVATEALAPRNEPQKREHTKNNKNKNNKMCPTHLVVLFVAIERARKQTNKTQHKTKTQNTQNISLLTSSCFSSQ
jgi:hypothetical protein